MIDQQPLCDDKLLLRMLRSDSDGLDSDSQDSGALLDHVERCQRCQKRLDELVAEESEWQRTIEALSPRLGGEAFETPGDIGKLNERQPAWSEALAKSLLCPPSHPEMLGRIGRYDVERLIGRGGMGVVFKAYDTELNRPVAIKLLAPYLAESGSARKRFAREARAAAAVIDEHVVAIHNVESGDEPGKPPFLVMKFIAGGSLQQRIDRDGPLEVCEILRIGMQVAKGLGAAHAQGLIHRDVKPSNILLDENVSRALLTDFGLARTQDDACLTRSGFHPGTPHYMSPEQVRGEDLDGRSDLFGLGCVLYALCSGHPPFRAESGYAVMRRITDETPRSICEQNSDIPIWLERVVLQLLEKDKAKRFQSAGEVAELLEQCLAHVQKPSQSPLPDPICGQSTKDSPGRGGMKRWLVGGLASFFALFAGVLVVLETGKGTLTIKSEADNVPIRIKRSDKVVDELKVSKSGKTVRLAAGEYTVELESDSEQLVIERNKVVLEHGETKPIEIQFRKSTGSDDMNGSKLDAQQAKPASSLKEESRNAPQSLVSLSNAIEQFNQIHNAKLLASNTPLLTEDEVRAAMWWHANHVDISPGSRKSLLDIARTRTLPPEWSLRLKNDQWDEDKLWHNKPATSKAVEIDLMNQEYVEMTIRWQFTSSGLASKNRENSQLVAAIAEFNKSKAADQPPLTLDETMAALSTLWRKDPRTGQDVGKLSETATRKLMGVADMHFMDGVRIESSNSNQEVGDSKFLSWRIELLVDSGKGKLFAESLCIRKRFLKVDFPGQ